MKKIVITAEDTTNHVNRKRGIMPYRYAIMCCDCRAVVPYKIRVAQVTRPADFQCGICGGNLYRVI